MCETQTHGGNVACTAERTVLNLTTQVLKCKIFTCQMCSPVTQWQAECLQDSTSHNPTLLKFGSGRLGKQLLLWTALLKSLPACPQVSIEPRLGMVGFWETSNSIVSTGWSQEEHIYTPDLVDNQGWHNTVQTQTDGQLLRQDNWPEMDKVWPSVSDL